MGENVSHDKITTDPPVVTQKIDDVNESAERLGAASTIGLSAEAESKMNETEKMLEFTHKAFSCVRNAQYDELDALLDEGVEVDSLDENGNSMLLVAAQQGLKR